MEKTRDIVCISIPFVVGVAVTEVFLHHLSLIATISTGSLTLTIVAFLLLIASRKDSRKSSFAILFFFTGIFCSASGLLSSFTDAGGLTHIFESAADSLKEIIAGIPFPHERTGSIVTALLTGDRSNVSRADIECFRQSGASHILALSGLHLGIIYTLASRLLAIIGHSPAARTIRSVAIILFSGFYTIMTGAGPSIVRAFLFIVLSEITRMDPERRRSPELILLFVLTVQLAINSSVISSLGFQLSYLAMTGIVFVYPRLSAWYPTDGHKRDPMRKIWQSAALTISCQLFTAPLVWIKFHTFPQYFLITNLLALPLTTIIVSTSVITTILSAAACCPEVLIICNDWMVEALMKVLETISQM